MYLPSEYERLWNSIRDALEASGQLSQTALDFWFRNVQIVYLDEESVVFSVENEAKQQTRSTRFAPLLADCTASILGIKPEVEVIVEKPAGENASAPVLSGLYTSGAPAAQKSQPKERRLSYNGEYTFENFIVGNSNKIAHAAAEAVAKTPSSTYNPLFIYGPSGLGKTHLMYAIVNRLLERNPDMNAIYINGEDFTNQLISSIRTNTNEAFREKYRKADVLLIDDIQFIAGKESTQEEFFHTFNALYADQKQIILTSDRPPKDMPTLEDRIRTRFEQGLIVDIQLPDYELRMAILRNKAAAVDLTIDDEVLSYIAEQLRSNIRQLEGIIKRFSATQQLGGGKIDMALARSLVPMFQQEEEPVNETAQRIIETVAKRYNLKAADLIGDRRIGPIQNARNMSMYMIRQITGLSYPNIGKIFNRDHSTIRSNITSFERSLKNAPTLETDIAEIRREIRR